MENLTEILHLGSQLVEPAFLLVGIIVAWKHTGKIDLDKTMQLAGDVVHIVKAEVAKHGDEEKAVTAAVDEVARLRRKRNLGAVASGKLAARLRTLTRED